MFELPDIIEPVEAEENCYVGRLKDAENDLNTFVFAGSDGTNTMRIYSHPVKYIADDGSVRDISLDIKARLGGGFISADHEIITTFKRKLSDGISLAYNDIAVMLVPQISAGTQPLASLSSDSKRVTYQMNAITSLVYELTYAGFKEDIVVTEYTGQTEYEFTLFTNGLTLCEEYGSYYLADAEGNVEATIGDIIVFTADERNNTMGSMTYETVRANQEYVLTIHLDADYLADEDTVYPIRIDPTIEINYDNNGAGAIEDVTISPTQTFSGTSGALNIGRIPSGGISRVLMRFPNLSLNGILADQITAATVELRDLMCQGDEDITVECHMYDKAGPDWSESGTTTWSSVGTSYLGALLDSHVISYGEGNVDGEQHRYSFDIISAIRGWATAMQSPLKGLVFKADDAFENQTGDDVKSWYKIFASYNRNNYKPSLSIVYTYSGGESFADAETLVLNAHNYVNIAVANEKKYFKFTPSTTGFYTFESFNIVSGDPKAWLYNSDCIELASKDDSRGNSNFRLAYHLVTGYTYYFAAGCYNATIGSYAFAVSQTTSADDISITSLSQGSQSNVLIDAPCKAKYFKFIPTVTGDYAFISSDSTGDPKAFCYNSSLDLISYNDDGAGNSNFKLTVSLEKGKAYYIVANQYSSKTGSYKFSTYRSLSYVHYYDSSFASDATLRNNITIANDFANFVFSNYFGITMKIYGSPSQYATVLDDCPTGSNRACITATCGSACNNVHHKNIYTISNQIYNSQRTDNRIYVLWTNRECGAYCHEEDGTHSVIDAIAVVIGKRPVIHFMHIAGDDDSQRLACMTLNIVHETAHVLKMNDVYNNIGHDVDRKTVCIMEKFDKYTAHDFYTNVSIGKVKPFCDSCMQAISGFTATTPIYGN